MTGWLDVERFSAKRFFQIGGLIASAMDEALNIGDDQAKLEAFKSNWHEQALLLAGSCRQIGLTNSARSADYIREQTEPSQTVHSAHLHSLFAALYRQIEWEMEETLFFHIRSNGTKYFHDDQQLFGKEVADKFPRLTEDISEAGKCLALSRYTAAVFHLMRVMEITVQMFGKKLGVPLTGEKNWQVILDQINVAIRNMPCKTTTQKRSKRNMQPPRHTCSTSSSPGEIQLCIQRRPTLRTRPRTCSSMLKPGQGR